MVKIFLVGREAEIMLHRSEKGPLAVPIRRDGSLG